MREEKESGGMFQVEVDEIAGEGKQGLIGKGKTITKDPLGVICS